MALSVFKRHEIKYFLNEEQYAQLIELFALYMKDDLYPISHIYNLYYDTDTYLMIRSSLEKPVYKEKLRVRSYFPVSDSDPVFVEIKKKYMNVVYKRRIEMPCNHALQALKTHDGLPDCQIGKEITRTLEFYETLHPVMFIAYDRRAYVSKYDEEFRVTFDRNLVYRKENLSLNRSENDISLLEEGRILMEVKSPGSMPLWLSHFLDNHSIRKTSFSKYGNAYIREELNDGKSFTEYL